MIVPAHLNAGRLHTRALGGDPVDVGADLDSALVHNLTLELHHLAGSVGHDLGALERRGIAVLEADSLAGSEAVEVLAVLAVKVLPLDVEDVAHRRHVRALRLVARVEGDGELPLLVRSHVRQLHLERVHHRHHAHHLVLKVVPHALLQQADGDEVLGAGDADLLAESVDGVGGVSLAAESLKGGQPGVVPAADDAGADELGQLPLGHGEVGDVEARELQLRRAVDAQLVQQPLVGLAADRELKRAKRMRDVLQRVADAVRVVVGRVDAPLVACVGVRLVDDPVRHHVPHVGVGVLHVALHAEHGLALGELALAHVLEQAEGLLHGAVPPGAVYARLAVPAHVLCVLVADEGLVLLDERHREVVQRLEVVRRVGHPVRLVPKPLNGSEDAVNELLLLGGRVGVVEAHEADATHLLGISEVEVHGLGVADVKVSVRLRREAGANTAASALEVSGKELWRVEEDVLAGIGQLDRVGESALLRLGSVLLL
mmetsp:Transcript_7234/g.30785  ORF Transcript_7234/g.30785 Transcript_7234/m.30785 type:complete len:487 (-) Transcript_7234:1111-2571(-)